MFKHNSKIKILSIFGVISLGLILGLLYGLGNSLSNIINHNYINYKLYNLTLFEIQSNTTTYCIIFVIISLIAYLSFKFMNRIDNLKLLNLFKDGKKDSAFKFLVKLSLLYALICLVFYSDIMLFIKILSLDISFGGLVTRAPIKIRILLIAFMIISMAFLVFITYILSRLDLIARIEDRLRKLIFSRQTQFTGLAILILLICFNIFITIYSSINRPDSPNIVLITIDTLRADRLGSYGYERDTSPNIDSLAEKGILFENAYAQSSWTLPSMSSMHTSLYPTQLGVIKFRTRIHDKLITLSEYLKNNFYNTYAVVANIVVSKIFGFSQGFNEFDETYGNYGRDVTSDITTKKAVNFIKNNSDSKFFLWVHYMDPHGHYINHDEFDYALEHENKGALPKELSAKSLNKVRDSIGSEELNYINDLYDEEISYTDKYIGVLIDSLYEMGIDDNTIIILTADHGEEFMDRKRFGHGHSLYQELIRVPLIIYDPRNPKQSGIRVSNNVEVRYIARTILDLTNLTNIPMGGYNLLDFQTDNASYGIVWSELSKKHNTVYLNDWKLITDTKNTIFELYNLAEDPYEKTNHFNSDRSDIIEVKKILLSKLSEHRELKSTDVKKIRLEEDSIKKLKALGYLQ